MVRLSTPRAKRKRGIVGMTSQLGNITRFSDITALTGGEAQVSWPMASWVLCMCKKFPLPL